MRPLPAPMTWMIEAHSAFLSRSDGDAFWTLRILPRMGSSAWNSLSRASLAVPSALSPSTMNSSLRSTSSLRQSASLAGSDEVSSAFLRRWCSLCWRAAIRVRAAAATFSRMALAWVLSPRSGRGEQRLELLAHDACHDPRGGRGAEHLLGLALELRLGQPDGDDRGQALEHVVGDHVVLSRAQDALGAQLLVDGLAHASLEAADVGAALARGHDVDEGTDRRVVAGAPAQGDVDA